MPPSRSEPKLSGTIARQHLEALADIHGQDVHGAALALLDAERREELEAALAVDWIRLSTIEALYDAYARHVGMKTADLHWAAASRGVEQTYKTIWRVMLKFTTDDALVKRTPMFYAKTYDTGRLASELAAPGYGRLFLTEWPDVPEFVRRGICIGVSTVLRVSGRKDVRVTDEKQPDGALFHARWEP